MTWQRHPDCVHPHFKNQSCPQRLCKTSEPTKPHINDARKAVAEKRKVRRKIDELDADSGDVDAREPVSDRSSSSLEARSNADISDAGSAGSDVSPSKDRLRVARKALTRAEISKRQREKDPEAYRKWNRERMRLARKNRKSDGSPKQP